jgi:hypothetical protein
MLPDSVRAERGVRERMGVAELAYRIFHVALQGTAGYRAGGICYARLRTCRFSRGGR